jgi:hypothetical protein
MRLYRTTLGVAAALLSFTALVSVADAGSPFGSRSSATSMVAARPNFAVPQVNNSRPAGTTPGRHVGGLGVPSGFGGSKSGGLSGVGVPGGIKSGGLSGSGVSDSTIKGAGTGMPSTAAGRASAQIGTIKGSHGQAQGREKNENGASGRQAESMQKSIGALKTSHGQAQGVERRDGATARQAGEMQKAIGQAAGSQGQEKGRDAKDGGGGLSKAQIQQAKDSVVNPKVNQDVASDPKSDNEARQKEIEKAKHVFDFAKNDKGVKPIVFPADKIVGKVPKPNPPKMN